MSPDPRTLTRICDGLADSGWLILDGAVPAPVLADLRQRLHELPETAFHTAGVGRQQGHGLQLDYRNDRIHWLEAVHPAEQAWLAWTDALRQHINSALFMGLQSYEAHFAHYAPGQRYGRHVDAFRGQANRVLSTVLYLNVAWDEADGGQLVIYPNHDLPQSSVDVSPQPGRLVIFLSEDMPHEVLPAKRDRYSIAGWFRVRSDSPL